VAEYEQLEGLGACHTGDGTRGAGDDATWTASLGRGRGFGRLRTDILRQNQMLCHRAGDLPPEQARDVICHCWVRVIGLDAIGVRLAVMRGAVTGRELEDTDRLTYSARSRR
jgi:hypothetical protein